MSENKLYVFEDKHFNTVKRCVACGKPWVRKHTCKKILKELQTTEEKEGSTT